jgi:16S rRNA (guanine527-N7)-methyltransferase
VSFTSISDTDVAAALEPFLLHRQLTSNQVQQVSAYLELLMRWNARINLTAVRDPAEILTRHFGESFFLANLLSEAASARDAIDIGSGAGFPGIPLRILLPESHVTLVESQNRKATFLKEVIRKLTLINIDVFTGRAENFQRQAEMVMLRAVERFQRVLPVAHSLVRRPGRMALLIGSGQIRAAQETLPNVGWEAPVPIPQSRERVVLLGRIP